jgi:hypothetical protein
MSYISGRVGRLLAGASTIVALSAALTLAPSATAVEADGPHFGQPVVGQCRNYTFNAMNQETNSTPVTACSNAHTAVVLAVPQLPASLNYSSSMDALSQVMENACRPALAKKLGRTAKLRHLSAYSLAWYFPTQTQRDHGARWIRCDLILLGGQALQRLPKNTSPVLPAAPLPKSVAGCRVGTNYILTVCAKTHQYRATGVLVLSGAYPGTASLVRTAKQKCPAKVSTPTNFYYSYSLKQAWKAGDKAITCWSHRSN